MTLRPRRFLPLSLAAALALTATACGADAAASSKQTVVFWQFETADRTVAVYEQAIARFEREHPDTDIRMELVPWAQQQQKLTAGVATGELPDVSMLGNNVVAQYQAQGLLEPLDRYMARWSRQEGADVAEQYWPGDKLYYHLDGRWWGAPLASETRILYYRADLFEQAGLDPDKPPATWAEAEEAARKLTTGDTFGWGLPQSKDYVTVQTFMSVYLSYGARMLRDGRCGFDTPQFRRALDYYTGIYRQGLTTPEAVNYDGTDMQGQLATGRAAMLIDSPAVWFDLQEQNPELMRHVRVAPVPAGPEGRFAFLGGWPLVLWETAEHKDAAAEWIHFLTSPQGALLDITSTVGVLPGRRSLVTREPWTSPPYPTLLEQMDRAFPYQYPDPGIPEMGAIEVDMIQNAVQRVALGQADVGESTRQLCQDIDRLIG